MPAGGTVTEGHGHRDLLTAQHAAVGDAGGSRVSPAIYAWRDASHANPPRARVRARARADLCHGTSYSMAAWQARARL